jgi:hypothetical protein
MALCILNIDTKWRWVSSFTLEPLYSWRKCPVPTGYEGAGWVSRAGQRSEIRMIVAMMMITAFQILSLNCRGLWSSKEKICKRRVGISV